MPIAITEDQLALADSIRSLTKAGEPSWPDLAALGIFGITQPEAVGGAGGSAADLAAALEQLTHSGVRGPLLPTLLAGLILGEHPLQNAIMTGTATVALQVSPNGPVLCAGESTHVLLNPAPTQWTLASATDLTFDSLDHIDLTRTLGNLRPSAAASVAGLPAATVAVGPGSGGVAVDGGLGEAAVAVGPDSGGLASSVGGDAGLDAGGVGEGREAAGESVTFDGDVRDVFAMLAAVEAAGVASWCVRTAAEYAKVREQFGRAIGSFQAIKHLCAVMHARAEAASVAAWDAARAFGAAEFPLAAAVAATAALDAGVDNAKDCIQVLGGIGFTWEHDAHRFLRRALSLRQLLGGSDPWKRRAAELAMSGARRTLTVGVGDSAVAARVAAIASLPPGDQRAAMVDAGVFLPSSPREALAIDEELARAGLTRPDLKIGAWAVPTILQHGTQEQKNRFVRPTLLGDLVWCQLFSEPGAGSDLAALRTRADKVDGGWKLTGQKVWTSLAREADWAICLARTDTTVPKHKGITYFLVKMDSPGLDIRPLREITGETIFNEVFLDDVFVPDDCLVGAPGDGWKLARTTLANERVAMGTGSSVGAEVEKLLQQAKEPTAGLGTLVANGTVITLLNLRATLAALSGQSTDSTVRKLLGVAHRQSVAEFALETAGLNGAVSSDVTHQFLLTRCLSIAGGTTQILLSVVGERVLGLPREP
ncbi:acyl-CoA dehydrogenase family protein [Catelliglobosispora koreensis]|uniref:acyl-CoA dehydrogenase family protein n=1 Tax=Catelliglobosispora koreensis TaxID=129052 RepID=UPI000371BF69|nr:acyl-CoA dehydrogenase family protein [Catelliglobosispora koreensis]